MTFTKDGLPVYFYRISEGMYDDQQQTVYWSHNQYAESVFESLKKEHEDLYLEYERKEQEVYDLSERKYGTWHHSRDPSNVSEGQKFYQSEYDKLQKAYPGFSPEPYIVKKLNLQLLESVFTFYCE